MAPMGTTQHTLGPPKRRRDCAQGAKGAAEAKARRGAPRAGAGRSAGRRGSAVESVLLGLRMHTQKSQSSRLGHFWTFLDATKSGIRHFLTLYRVFKSLFDTPYCVKKCHIPLYIASKNIQKCLL